VIDDIELEGLEYIYAPNGVLLSPSDNNNNMVYVVTDEAVEKLRRAREKNPKRYTELVKSGRVRDLILNTPTSYRNTMITNEELNLRGFLYMIRVAENKAWDGANNPTAYDSQYGGGTFGDGQNFDQKYAEHPNDKIESPWGTKDENGNIRTSTAAGAYMFLYGTWLSAKRGVGVDDFKPESQDAMAVYLIQRRGVLDDIKERAHNSVGFRGVLDNRQLRYEWPSLPNGSQSYGSMRQARNAFRRGVMFELQENSQLATPQGELELNH